MMLQIIGFACAKSEAPSVEVGLVVADGGLTQVTVDLSHGSQMWRALIELGWRPPDDGSYMPHPQVARFDGSDYDPRIDDARLTKQMSDIWRIMKDSSWRSLREIADATGHPEASISAQLRHFRKARFGSYVVEKVRHGSTFRYRVLPPLTGTPGGEA